jgi:uncharacterized membrane protein YqaE (UPF0057 family)
MKKSIINFGIILSALIFMNACTVEKRLYRKGMNIEWNAGLKKAKVNASNEEELTNEVASTNEKSEIVYNVENAVTDNITSDDNMLENTSTFIVTDEETTPVTEETKVQTVAKVSETKKSNKVETTTSTEKVVKQKNAPRESKIEKSKSAGSISNDELIGIILCLVGLAPFGVMIAKGKGSSAFKVNLMLWVGGFVSYIVGIIITVATLSFVGAIFAALGGLLLLASFIHGLVSILK